MAIWLGTNGFQSKGRGGGKGRGKGQGEGGGGEGVFATGQINGTIAALQIVINLSHCLIE